MNRYKLLFIGLSFLVYEMKLMAQLPSAVVSVSKNSVCINETIIYTSQSSNSVRYEWDFCLEDLTQGTVTSTDFTVAGLSNGDGYWLGEDGGTWFGFVVSAGNHSIIRLDYGDDPTSTPIATNLGDLGGELAGKSPRGIDLINYEGNWYGITAFLTASSTFTLMDFGSALTNTPTATSIGNFGATGRVFDLRLVEQNGDLLMVFPYYNTPQLYRINFGDSFYNTVAGGDIYYETITDAVLPRGIDLINIEGNWKSLIVSESNSNVHQIDLGTDLTATMSYEATYNFPSATTPNKLEIVRDGSQFYGVIGSTGSNLAVIDFKDFDVSNAPEDVTPDNFQRLRALVALKYDGRIIVQGPISSSTTLNTLEFENSCEANTAFSSELEVTNRYSAQGDYRVELRVFNAGDSLSIREDTITVLDQIAPDISFTTDNACISALNTFTSSISGLTSYSWDFNGDNIEDSDLENPEFQFSAPGDYTVRLDVTSSGGCNNFYEEVITIYADPPVPVFNFSASTFCIDSEITFENTTNESGFEDVISYEWDFDGEATITTKNASHSFSSSGMKTVTLKAIIPGCENSYEEEVDILVGPTAGFSSSSVCESGGTKFTNLSANASSYLWDFGDGTSSTDTDPIHIYPLAGTYEVSLESTDVNGCIVEFSQSVVTICAEYPVALIDKSSSITCINESIGFTNQSSNSVRNEWDFCLEDLTQGTITSTDFTVAGLSNGDGYWLGEDGGTWFGFVVSAGNHSIIRLDYGDDPTSTPIVTNLGDLGGELADKSPRGIDLINYEGNWYGITAFLTASSTFTLMDFGSALTNTPTATSIGNFGATGRVFDLRLVEQNGDLLMVFPYYNTPQLYRINFGDSFYNTVAGGDIYYETITDAVLPRGIDLINIEGNWKSLIVSESNSNVHQIDLGTDLTATMSYEATYNFPSATTPNKLEIVRDGSQFYGVIGSTGSNLAVIDFKDFDVSNAPEDVTPDTFAGINSLNVTKFEGKIIVQGIVSSSTTLNTLEFENSCEANTAFSSELEVTNRYSAQGDYRVELRVFNAGDSLSIREDTITVLDQIAPDISFTTDNACISVLNTFTSSISGLTSYSWDFNGDNIEDSDLENPAFQFSAPGDYTVRLDVTSSGGCNNFYEEVITIYADPPVPVFNFSASTFCIGSEITFENTTNESGFEDVISYEWDFDGEATITTKNAISILFRVRV